MQPEKTVATSTRLLQCAETWDRAGDLQIFSLTLSQLSYRGSKNFHNVFYIVFKRVLQVCKDYIVFTRILQGFYKVFTRFPQGCYKVFTRLFTRLLQGFYKAFRSFFTMLLEVFYKVFTRFLESVCFTRLLQGFYKVFARPLQGIS